MNTADYRFGTFFWRITASQMITYFIMGIIAASLLNYRESFAAPPLSYLMKPVDSPWVALGPVLQIFRGLVFSIALWFFKEVFLQKKFGWLKLWGLLVGLSVLSTTGPAPSSLEGFIYTTIPFVSQIKGYIEVIPQTLLFSLLVFHWYDSPKRLWNILSIVFVSIIVLLCTLGFLASLHVIKVT